MNIEFEKMQNLVSEIIEREMLIEFEYDFKYMKEEQAKKHSYTTDRLMNLHEMLSCKLDEEGKKLLNEFIDLKDRMLIMEIDYYFERGVRCGLSSLSYLKEYFHIF